MPWIDAEFIQACLNCKIGRGAELADGDFFASQILNTLDLRSTDNLKSEQVESAGNHRQVRTLRVGGDRQRAGGKKKLALIGKQGLHAQGATVHRQIFGFQAVFLEQAFLIGDPDNGVERRHAAAADANLVRRERDARNKHKPHRDSGR